MPPLAASAARRAATASTAAACASCFDSPPAAIRRRYSVATSSSAASLAAEAAVAAAAGAAAAGAAAPPACCCAAAGAAAGRARLPWPGSRCSALLQAQLPELLLGVLHHPSPHSRLYLHLCCVQSRSLIRHRLARRRLLLLHRRRPRWRRRCCRCCPHCGHCCRLFQLRPSFLCRPGCCSRAGKAGACWAVRLAAHAAQLLLEAGEHRGDHLTKGRRQNLLGQACTCRGERQASTG